MQLRTQLVHAEAGRRVVRVSAREGGACLGSALGEAASAEEAEDRAIERLLQRLGGSGGAGAPGSGLDMAELNGAADGAPRASVVGSAGGPSATPLSTAPGAAAGLPRSGTAVGEPPAPGVANSVPPQRTIRPPSLPTPPAASGGPGATTTPAGRRPGPEPPRVSASALPPRLQTPSTRPVVSAPATAGAELSEPADQDTPVQDHVDSDPTAPSPASPATAATASLGLLSTAEPSSAALGSSSAGAPHVGTPPTPPTAPEPPPDPEDWSDELAELELELRRLGWGREQEAAYLERVFGHPSRGRLTRYADLMAYLAVVRRAPIGAVPEALPVPLRRRDLLEQSDLLLGQLHWEAAQGRAFLERHFTLSSRQQLSDEQLLHFNLLLEEEATALLPAPSPPAVPPHQ